MCTHWTRGGEGEGYKKKTKAYSKSKTGCAPQAYCSTSCGVTTTGGHDDPKKKKRMLKE